jgi:hypothetical protein
VGSFEGDMGSRGFDLLRFCVPVLADQVMAAADEPRAGGVHQKMRWHSAVSAASTRR